MDAREIISVTVNVLSVCGAAYAAIVARKALHTQRNAQKWVVSTFLCEIFPSHFFQERQILPDLPQRV
jgi:hypothetical protein